MLRAFIFALASVTIFLGIATVIPLVEDGVQFGQFAASGYVYDTPQAIVPPSCIISAHPQVVQAGESASIAWNTRNASSAELTPAFGEVPLQGGFFIEPQYSEVYTLRVYSFQGMGECSTYITVQ